MPLLEWKEEFSVGHPDLDRQHRRFLELINTFSAQAQQRTDLRFLLSIMGALIDHAETHFTTEEKLLRTAGYPKLADHERQHMAFTDQLLQLEERLESNGPDLRREIERFLKDWYISHVFGSDQDYKGAIARLKK
jgi:hemerythrin